MALREEVLRFLVEVQGAGELDALIAELKQLTPEHPECRVLFDVLPAVRRPSLMGRGAAAPRYSLAVHLGMQRHMVCHFIAPTPELSHAQWDALLEERERMGRPLSDSEARRVLAAEGGDDVHH
jgi:hypothetical protein